MTAYLLGAWIFQLSKSMASSQRRWRRGCGRMILASLVLVAMLGLPVVLQAANPVHATKLDASSAGPDELKGLPGANDSVYNQFLCRFARLRANATRRHYLIREVLATASQNQIDPDLLFALVAVESDFNSSARSNRGALGLGQMMYATAHSFTPHVVRHPKDLYNVHRNLYATAFLLHQLLIEHRGNLRVALTEYHLGPGSEHLPRRIAERYVWQICTYFASLKTRKEYRELLAMSSSGTGLGAAEN